MASGRRRIRVSVGAAGVIENILQGTALQYPGVDSSVRIWGITETNHPDETMDVIFGTDTVAEGIVLPAESGAGEGPLQNRHLLVEDALSAADQLQIRLRNANVAATVVVIDVEVQPV